MWKDNVSCISKVSLDTLDKGTTVSLHTDKYKNYQGGFQGQALNIKFIPTGTV